MGLVNRPCYSQTFTLVARRSFDQHETSVDHRGRPFLLSMESLADTYA